jgi:cation diffusion facilitator family transporter
MKKSTRLSIALGLSSIFVVVEIIGGLYAGSLAVLSDAAHMLTDVAGFGVALAATIASETRGDENYTYGLVRAEVLGALISVLLLWLITIILVYNAYLRALLWFDGAAEPVGT